VILIRTNPDNFIAVRLEYFELSRTYNKTNKQINSLNKQNDLSIGSDNGMMHNSISG